MASDYVVYKTAFMPTGTQDVAFHEEFELLHCDYQHGKIAVWYRCHNNARPVSRKVLTVGTGDNCPGSYDAVHLGTVLLHSGALVLHAFLKKR